MEITIKLAMAEALAFQKSETTPPDLQQVLEILKDLGMVLMPVHHGATDPLLAPYFTIEVQDMEQAEKVIQRLRQISVVEAAYIKPPAELP
jgi:hypothetical protein